MGTNRRLRYLCKEIANLVNTTDLLPYSYLTYKNVEETAPPAEPKAEETQGHDTASAEAGTPGTEGKPDEASEEDKKPKGPLRNQFNFSERAAQTVNNPYRVRRSHICNCRMRLAQ